MGPQIMARYKNSIRFSGGHTRTADSTRIGHEEEDLGGDPAVRAAVCSGITGAVLDGAELGGDDDGGCSHTTASRPLIFSCVGWYPLGQAGPGAPAGPDGPGLPGAPLGPAGPDGPAGPLGPDGPLAPGLPDVPGAPDSPTAPLGPGAPVGPEAPGAPVGPVGPGGPLGPGWPAGPAAPAAPGGPAMTLAGGAVGVSPFAFSCLSSAFCADDKAVMTWP